MHKRKKSRRKHCTPAWMSPSVLRHHLCHFLTEELWQRLPRRESDKVESIHVSRYPAVGKFTRDENVELEVDLMMNVVKQVRSLRGEYKLTNKQKTNLFIEVKNDDSKSILAKYTDFITILTRSNEIIYQNDIPVGCVVTVVNDDDNAHLMLKVFLSFLFLQITK